MGTPEEGKRKPAKRTRIRHPHQVKATPSLYHLHVRSLRYVGKRHTTTRIRKGNKSFEWKGTAKEWKKRRKICHHF